MQNSEFWVDDDIDDNSDDDNLSSLDARISSVRQAHHHQPTSPFMDIDVVDGFVDAASTPTSDQVTYIAKCGAHRSPLNRWRPVRPHEVDELSESEQDIVRKALGSVRTDQVTCRCLSERCKIVRFLRSNLASGSNSPDTSPSTSGASAATSSSSCHTNDLNKPHPENHIPTSSTDFYFTKDDFRNVHDQLVNLAGGKPRARKIYERITELAGGSTRVDSRATCNTALMQLCSTTFKDDTDPTRAEDRAMLYAQIYSLIKLYINLDPEALFVRNSQDAGALELAALTNKVVVTKYLSILHTVYGRDVNSPNKQGHSLLHLLARKGDDCADTLEALLKLRVVADNGRLSKRLYRLDVLNAGSKTPLDVAVACVDLFSVGKDRTIYTKVISIIHDTIEEEAREMELESLTLEEEEHRRRASLTFENVF